MTPGLSRRPRRVRLPLLAAAHIRLPRLGLLREAAGRALQVARHDGDGPLGVSLLDRLDQLEVFVRSPWAHQRRGDLRLLEEQWPSMVAWLDFVERTARDQRHPSRVEARPEPAVHEQYLWDGTFHFGEWIEPTPIAEDGTPGPTMPDPVAWATATR